MLTLNTLKSSKGSHRNTKRLGRGQGSGQGTQAGKGHKGQKARKSGHVRTGFEGNNLPLFMRLPKRGFSNAPFKTEYAIVSLQDIEKKLHGEVLSREALIASGLLKGALKRAPIKILGGDKAFSRKVSILKDDQVKLSKSAEKAIVSAGGSI